MTRPLVFISNLLILNQLSLEAIHFLPPCEVADIVRTFDFIFLHWISRTSNLLANEIARYAHRHDPSFLRS